MCDAIKLEKGEAQSAAQSMLTQGAAIRKIIGVVHDAVWLDREGHFCYFVEKEEFEEC